MAIHSSTERGSIVWGRLPIAEDSKESAALSVSSLSSIPATAEPEVVAAGLLSREAFPAFRPRFPWLTGDLQTLRNYLLKPYWDLSPWPETPLVFDVSDGSGDRLLAKLHEPAAETRRPLAMLVHGLTGCEDSSYIRRIALTLLQAGYPVLRLNLRSAGPGQALAQQHYHAGRSQDLRDALNGLLAARPAYRDRGLVLVGFSLGGNVLLKCLGEGVGDFPVVAASAVSAPIDLKATQVRIMQARNGLYQRYLLRSMKAESRAPAELLATLHSVYAFDDQVVAPANGFAGADDYYRQSSAKTYLGGIAVPTLVIHAEDDPWIPAAEYRAFDWAANPSLTLLLSPGGGHVGFHGRGSPVPWHDRCILPFLDARLG